jgi:hypothetical protein
MVGLVPAILIRSTDAAMQGWPTAGRTRWSESMTLRADHVAGAAFVVAGILVLALSGDLPFGELSMPGSGFLPRLVAITMMFFGLVLMAKAGNSAPFATLSWSDGQHAGLVVVIPAIAVSLYTWLGFITTMVLMMIAMLIMIERRNPLAAGVYSIVTVLGTYGIFKFLLNAPLPDGPLGF